MKTKRKPKSGGTIIQKLNASYGGKSGWRPTRFDKRITIVEMDRHGYWNYRHITDKKNRGEGFTTAENAMRAAEDDWTEKGRSR
jgi:hypothetical protein